MAWRRPMRQTVIFGLALSGLVSGCGAAQKPTPKEMTAEEMLAIQSRVVDCEWKAADQYDDGRSTVSALAQRIHVDFAR